MMHNHMMHNHMMHNHMMPSPTPEGLRGRRCSACGQRWAGGRHLAHRHSRQLGHDVSRHTYVPGRRSMQSGAPCAACPTILSRRLDHAIVFGLGCWHGFGIQQYARHGPSGRQDRACSCALDVMYCTRMQHKVLCGDAFGHSHLEHRVVVGEKSAVPHCSPKHAMGWGHRACAQPAVSMSVVGTWIMTVSHTTSVQNTGDMRSATVNRATRGLPNSNTQQQRLRRFTAVHLIPWSTCHPSAQALVAASGA
jgi:hypothetical protein